MPPLSRPHLDRLLDDAEPSRAGNRERLGFGKVVGVGLLEKRERLGSVKPEPRRGVVDSQLAEQVEPQSEPHLPQAARRRRLVTSKLHSPRADDDIGRRSEAHMVKQPSDLRRGMLAVSVDLNRAVETLSKSQPQP